MNDGTPLVNVGNTPDFTAVLQKAAATAPIAEQMAGVGEHPIPERTPTPGEAPAPKAVTAREKPEEEKPSKKSKRPIFSIELKGPAKQMVDLDIARRIQQGQPAAQRRCFEACVIAHLGPRYPKLLEAYRADVKARVES